MGFMGVFGKSKASHGEQSRESADYAYAKNHATAQKEEELQQQKQTPKQTPKSVQIKGQETLQSDPRNREIIEQVKQVVDPEINMDIWTLGLIYDIQHHENTVAITLPLTSQMCPFGPQIMEDLKSRIQTLGKTPELELVFSPPWKPSEELRELLGV